MKLNVYHNPGEIVRTIIRRNKINYLDQLSSEIKWIPNSSIGSYLKKTYGINSHEYYDLIMYGGCVQKLILNVNTVESH